MNFCQKISLLCNLALWNLKSMEMLWILNLKKNISKHINFEYSTTFLANCVNDYDISKGCTIRLISSCTPMKQTWSRAPLQLYLDICYIFFFLKSNENMTDILLRVRYPVSGWTSGKTAIRFIPLFNSLDFKSFDEKKARYIVSLPNNNLQKERRKRHTRSHTHTHTHSTHMGSNIAA